MSPPTCGNRRALQKTCNDVFCPAGPITGATEDPRSLTQYQQSHCRALLRLAHVSALPCTPSNPQREPLVSLCRLHIQNMNLGLCDLGKISNCIFFDRYYDCDFKFAVKLQLNIVNNVQHRMSIVTLPETKGKKTIETITEILIVSIKTITKYLFVLVLFQQELLLFYWLLDYIPPIECIKY